VKTHEKLGLPGPKDFDWKIYWKKVRARAKELKSDGCTGVADIYLDACYEHDVHCRTHKTIYHLPLSSKEAATVFRERIHQMSWFNGLSPMAWWRWAGVRVLGPQWS